MRLLNRFKKRKTDSTFPENELEKCLMLAASDLSARKDFYQKLLWNDLFVLTIGTLNGEEGIQNLEENTGIKMVTFDNGYIPVFTSENRIFDKQIIKEEVAYLSIKGQDLFDLAKGVSFVLNPYSAYGKELLPEEIENMMNGTIYDKLDEDEIEHVRNQELNKIYERASQRQKDLIFLEGYHFTRLKKNDKLKIEESIMDFKKCLELVPDHWPSMFMMAKSYQRLEKHTESLELLETAFTIELENHFIPMEAAMEARYTKNLNKVLFYSEEALKRKPDDIAVMGNYAMNLLIAEKDLEAKAMIEKAIQIHPNDPVNRKIQIFVNSVAAGIRQRPHI